MGAGYLLNVAMLFMCVAMDRDAREAPQLDEHSDAAAEIFVRHGLRRRRDCNLQYSMIVIRATLAQRGF